MRIETTLRGLLTIFFRQKKKFLAAFFLAILVGLAFIMLSVPIYMSTGSLLIKFGSSASFSINSAGRQSQTAISQSSHELIASYVEVLQSRKLLESLVNTFGAAHIYPKLASQSLNSAELTEAALKNLKRDLAIRSSESNDVIEISLFNSDPQMAAQLVHRLQEQFVALQTEMYNKPQTDFLSGQTDQAYEKLIDDQKKLQAFKAKTGVSSIDTEISILLQEKNSMNTSMATAALTSALSSIKEAQDKVDHLKARKAALLTTYMPDSAPVQQIQSSIDFAKVQLGERQKLVANSSTQTNAGARNSSYVNQRIAHLEAQRGEYNDLYRQVQLDADNYKTYLSQFEEEKINNKLNQGNITRIFILDEPVAAAKPIKPIRILIVAFSLMAGVVLGFAVIIVAETLDERFINHVQVAELMNVPTTFISDMTFKKFSGMNLLSNRQYPVNALVQGGVNMSATTVITPTLPVSNLLELYEMIKNVFPDRTSRVVQFCSAYPHEGANLIAFDMAIAVAMRTPQRVLFIDTSTEPQGVRRQLANAVDALPDASFKNSNLLGFASAAVVIGTNLGYVRLRDHDYLGDASLANIDAIGDMVEVWRKTYELVIIPSPSILTDVLGKILAKVTDGCVMVVEAERTRAPVAMQVKNIIEGNGGRVVCAVLNKRKFYIPKQVYSHLWL